MKTLTVLDQCDYVYMHIGLSIGMNCRAIVTSSWAFEMKGWSILELAVHCCMELLQSQLITQDTVGSTGFACMIWALKHQSRNKNHFNTSKNLSGCLIYLFWKALNRALAFTHMFKSYCTHLNASLICDMEEQKNWVVEQIKGPSDKVSNTHQCPIMHFHFSAISWRNFFLPSAGNHALKHEDW